MRGVAPEVSAQRSGAANGGGGRAALRASWKLTMTSRCKSGRRRNQVTFVVARRRLGRPGRRSAGSSLPSSGRRKPAVRNIKRSLPRRNSPLREEPTGSRVLGAWTKAMEEVKRLEMQPRRTQRRRGRGTLAQPSWEQERAVSAPAVRRVGCHPTSGLGAPSPISRVTAKWVRAERQSERRVVLVIPWQQNHGGGKAPYLVCASGAGKRW